MHIFNKILSVILAFTITLAMGAFAFADEVEEITIIDNNFSVTSQSSADTTNVEANDNLTDENDIDSISDETDYDANIEDEDNDSIESSESSEINEFNGYYFIEDDATIDSQENAEISTTDERYNQLFEDLADTYGDDFIDEGTDGTQTVQLINYGIKMLSSSTGFKWGYMVGNIYICALDCTGYGIWSSDPDSESAITKELYNGSVSNEVTSFSSNPWAGNALDSYKNTIMGLRGAIVHSTDTIYLPSSTKSWFSDLPSFNVDKHSNIIFIDDASHEDEEDNKVEDKEDTGDEGTTGNEDTGGGGSTGEDTDTNKNVTGETDNEHEEEVHVHSWHAVFTWMDESKFEYDRNGPLSDPTCTCSLACDECGAFENNVDVTLTIEDIAYPTCQNTTVTYRASIQERDDGSIDTLYEAKLYNMYAIHDWVINYQWDDSFTYSESYVVDGAPDFISRTNGAWAQSMLTEAEKNGDEKISFPYATCTCSVICADCNIQDTGVSLTKDVALSGYEKPSCDPGYATFTAEVSECYTTMLTDEEYENLNLNDEHTYEIDPVHDWVTEYTWGEEPTYVDDDTYTTTYEGTSYCSLCGIENDNLQQYTPVQTDLVQPSCRDGYVSFKVVIQEGSSDDDATFVELGDGHEDTITYTLDGNGQHKWSTERYSTEWDVDEDGNPVCYFTVICGICGTTQVIEATSYETVTVKDPTCDDPGQTILQATLDNNGVVIVDNVGGPTEEIPALDSEHSWVVKDGSETWNPEAGSFTVDFECTECGEVVTEESEINFTVEYDENGDIESVEMEATVDYNGEEYTFDSDDVLGTGETPDYSDPEVQEEVKKIISGHNWVLTDSTEGTDGNPGTYEFECEDCEATITVTGDGADEVAKSVFNVSTSSSDDSSDSGTSTYSSDSGSGATVSASGSSSSSSSGSSSADDTSAYETSSSGTGTNAMGGSTSSDYGTTSDAMGGTYGDEDGDGSTATTTSTPKTGDELLYVSLLTAFIATAGIGCTVLVQKRRISD